jgi:PX domain
MIDSRLLDALQKRYPFRQIPLLPPKRLAGMSLNIIFGLRLVNGHYLSAESDFVERRRRGLSRFMNSIVRHPVLRDDDIVVTFITIPTVHPLTIEIDFRNFLYGVNPRQFHSWKNSQTANYHLILNPVSPQN